MDKKAKLEVIKSWYKEVASVFCFCLFKRMPFSKSQNITKPHGQKFKFLPLDNPVMCHNDKIHIVRTGWLFFRFFWFWQNSVQLIFDTKNWVWKSKNALFWWLGAFSFCQIWKNLLVPMNVDLKNYSILGAYLQIVFSWITI